MAGPIQRFILLTGFAVTACGSESHQQSAQGSETDDAEATESRAPVDEGDDDAGWVSARAGGETSEFGGNRVYCLEDLTRAVELARPDVAAWVQAVAGVHRVPFAWNPRFLMEPYTDFSDSTHITLVIEPLSAREVIFETGCVDERTLQLELSVELEVEDESLGGSITLWVGGVPNVAPAEGGVLSSVWSPPHSLETFHGSIADLGSQTAGRRELSVRLVLDGTSARGQLEPFFAPGGLEAGPGGEPEPTGGSSPLGGVFPDDGCASTERLLTLTESLDGFPAPTARQLIDDVAAFWNDRTLLAQWENGDATEATFTVGEPMGACMTRTYHYPGSGAFRQQGAIGIQTLTQFQTADAAVALEELLAFRFEPGSTGVVAESIRPSTWIPAESFESATGIVGVKLSQGSFGSLDFRTEFDIADGTFSGRLFIDEWLESDSRGADFPTLDW